MIPTREIFHSSLALTGQLTKLQLNLRKKNGKKEKPFKWHWKKFIKSDEIRNKLSTNSQNFKDD